MLFSNILCSANKTCLLALFLFGTTVRADVVSHKIIKERLRSEKRLKALRRRLPGNYSIGKELLDVFVPTALTPGTKSVNFNECAGKFTYSNHKDSTWYQPADFRNVDVPHTHKHRKAFLGIGAIMAALSGGIISDSFREAMNDINQEEWSGPSFDSRCVIVLIAALFASYALRKAFFSGWNDNRLTQIGSVLIHLSVASATLSMVFMDSMGKGSDPMLSSSAFYIYMTGGFLAIALMLAIIRKTNARASTLFHGAGAVTFVAGACLLMNCMRERLGDVAEFYRGDSDVDFNGQGLGVICMSFCIVVGFAWLCYITFPFKKNPVYSVIGSSCILAAGGLALAAINGLGAVTEAAAGAGAKDMSMADFITSDSEPRLFLIIAGGLFVFGFLLRFLMKLCEPKQDNPMGIKI